MTMENEDNPDAIFCVASDEFVTRCPLSGAECLDFKVTEADLMSRYEHSADLGWKAYSEGGVAELIFFGGLRMDELPNDMPPPVRALVRQLLAVKPTLEELRRYLDKAVSEYDYSAWDEISRD